MFNKNQTLIFGGSVLIALIGVGLFYWFRPYKTQNKTITNSDKKDNIKDTFDKKSLDEKDTVHTPNDTPVVKSTEDNTAPTLEDDDEDDDEDEESNSNEVALKTAYDDALRMAKKLLNGGKFSKAADKFTEAIGLADQIPSASKDIITLYNNRSAMYEKCGELDSSLNDIMVVLTMDANHLKARVRRARIYEVQGRVKEALDDYALAVLLERSKGLPPTNMEKIDELVKQLATSQLNGVMEMVKAGKVREELVEAVTSKGGPFMEGEQWSDMTALDHMTLETIPARFETVFTLACFDLSRGAFRKGFDEISRAFHVLRSAEFPSANEKEKQYHEMYTELMNTSESFRSIAASLEDLHGTSLHLRADLQGAKQCYENSLAIRPLPHGFETALKLASIFVEIGTTEESSRMYDSILTSISTESDELEKQSKTAWLCIHRVSKWVTRDEQGKYPDNALEKAKENVDEALALTAFYEDDSSKERSAAVKSCRLLAFVKRVHVLIQAKSQMGQQPDNDDIKYAKEAVEEAKKLFPDYETALMLEVEFMTTDGNFDGAVEQIDRVIAKSDGDDAIPYVFKANTLAQKAMMHFSIAQQYNSQKDVMEGQNILKEVDELFEKAIELDANGIEALVHSAQLKTMMGDMKGSLGLSERALPLVRSRDEALEVLNIKIMTEAQLAAVEEIQRSNGVTA